MRARTAACAVGLAAVVAALVLSIRSASAPRRPEGKREYTFACWGAAREVAELRELVIGPINAAGGEFRLRLVPIPGNYQTKLCTMIAAGRAPDFFYLSQEYVPAFAAQGALMDLTDRIARDGDPVTDLSAYYPDILRRVRHDGRIYGLPWIAQPVILYCNVEMFGRAGVPLPDQTWDWRRFVSAGRKLTRDTDGDGTPDEWATVINTGWPPYQMWVWQNGAEVVDARTGRLNLDDPRVVRAIDFRAGLIHRHRIAPPLSLVGERGFAELFRQGKVAMFMGGAADDLDRTEGLEVVAAELPAGPTGIRATFAWTASLHISPDTPDPQAAFAVWKKILDGIHRWKVPAPRRPLAARLEVFEPRKARAAEVIRRSMEYMRTPAVFERQVEWDTTFREEFEDRLLREGGGVAEGLGRVRPMLEALR